MACLRPPHGRDLGSLWCLSAQRSARHGRSRPRALQGVFVRRRRLLHHRGAGAAALLKVNHSDFNFPSKGVWISLFAGALGAIGAFGILLAFGAKGTPTVVMAIVFAGAPIVNAVAATLMHPPKGGLAAVPWQFYVGIVLAAAGGCIVSYYKPAPAPKTTAKVAAAAPSNLSGPR